ncbi:hypothetical protein [Pseudarthrobacter sp. BIM B-2242]|uniref:hypothetical protein n=1 Tax=Pseudarthrobacter sp. BIM B-2242 TaxID=2772401 RepID=UPI00168BAE36|nr:hypothetical protein [Pseudarthrobacter sp. BIM B-2242]QOD05688.1 hypothetical protein IDT60_21840 [Pseudarthrobacter sp. BIM B-2242]
MAWGKSEKKPSDSQPLAPTYDPIALARAAFENGDQFFQTQIAVNELVAFIPSLARIDNRMNEFEGVASLLGHIESIGWHLEHVGYTFLEKASRSSAGSGYGWNWGAGQTIGIYLFRRTQA